MTSLEDAAVHDDAAASAGADDHAEHDVGALRRAIDGFRQREAVGVVRESHGALERRREIAVQRFADQPGGIRVLHQSRGSRYRTRHADADRARAAELSLKGRDKVTNGAECRGVITARSWHSKSEELGRAIEGDAFDLAAAKVDTYQH